MRQKDRPVMYPWNKLASLEATLVKTTTYPLADGVRCRATSVAKKDIGKLSIDVAFRRENFRRKNRRKDDWENKCNGHSIHSKLNVLLSYWNNFYLLVNETISGRPGLLWDTSLSFQAKEKASSSSFVGLMPDMSRVNARKMCHTNATNVTTQSHQEDLFFEWSFSKNMIN